MQVTEGQCNDEEDRGRNYNIYILQSFSERTEWKDTIRKGLKNLKRWWLIIYIFPSITLAPISVNRTRIHPVVEAKTSVLWIPPSLSRTLPHPITKHRQIRIPPENISDHSCHPSKLCPCFCSYWWSKVTPNPWSLAVGSPFQTFSLNSWMLVLKSAMLPVSCLCKCLLWSMS